MPRNARVLSGEALRQGCHAALLVLEHNAEAINALNVFPVPDGDTGTNMFLTMRAVEEELGHNTADGVEAVASALAHGALLGARGNSGVILSQFFRGFSSRLIGKEAASAADLAASLEAGGEAAYKAVSKPVEGTMLTVIREAALAARRATRSPATPVKTVLRAALSAADEAVQKTPELLSVLREAEVVDAGGQGFALILQALYYSLQGKDVMTIRLEPKEAALGRVSETFLSATEGMTYGYCSQFVIEGRGLDPDAVRQAVGVIADSVVVIGDGELLKVHAHSHNPERVLAYGKTQGTLQQVKVDNIDEQHREFLVARRKEHPPAPLAAVAVASGQGMTALLQSLGAVVVAGGQSMNPSCQELLDAVQSINADTVVLLPNNPNIIATAQQAASLSRKPIAVVPTRTLPQGIAALLAFNPQGERKAILAAMKQALVSIKTGEIACSVRNARINGIRIARGAFMGFLEGELVATGETPLRALQGLAEQAGPGESSLITLYWGADVQWEGAEEAARMLREHYPTTEIETVHGGQPHYQYIVSFE
ncbi:MAG: DAK2 domain-containing protein [Chloroflexi bacterium]|nr:DAK2 domain-containing protein [Chloroflexota bacterium]